MTFLNPPGNETLLRRLARLTTILPFDEVNVGQATVRCICAIGQSGQLGLHGKLPWEGRPEPIFADDVARFFALTRGHVLLAGPATVASIPPEAWADRSIEVIRSDTRPQDAIAKYPGRVVFIGGGPAVWDKYSPYIQHWDITRLPYDGPADRWFNPEWVRAKVAWKPPQAQARALAYARAARSLSDARFAV